MDIERKIIRVEDIIDHTFKPALRVFMFRFEKTSDKPMEFRKLTSQEIIDNEQILETAKQQMRIALRRYGESTKFANDAQELRKAFEKAEKMVRDIFKGSTGDSELLQEMKGSIGELRRIRNVRGANESSRDTKSTEPPKDKAGIFGGILKRFRK
ncbi:MAG: hypothetical protein ABID45_01585 [Patescibacteria group bacterium]